MGPDKIWVTTSEMTALLCERRHDYDEAYIRKDALLEWAKKNNKRIDTEDGDYTLGYVSAMIDLIEKLNTI